MRYRLTFWRALLPTLAVFALLAPAAALACGPYIPLDGDAAMDRERGLVIWDGTTEQMLMELAVTSDAAEAAWIFPSPSPATVELGDAAIFSELETLTQPQIVIEHKPGWPSFALGAGAPEGAPGGGVDVLSQQTLGPFEVSTLAADESGALAAWLEDNGYPFPAGLDAIMQPYVDAGWYYVAVKLTPAGAGEALDGALDPLWITFATDEPLYTMRAAAMAPYNFPLILYVLAEHRVDKSATFGFEELAFADWIEPEELLAGSVLRARLPSRMFLTKFREQVDPAQVNADYIFTFAVEDTAYRETIVRTVYDDYTWLGVTALLCCGLLILGGVGGGLLLARRRAARAG